MCQEKIRAQHKLGDLTPKNGQMSDFLWRHFHLTHLVFAIGEFDTSNYLCQMRGHIFYHACEYNECGEVN